MKRHRVVSNRNFAEAILSFSLKQHFFSKLSLCCYFQRRMFASAAGGATKGTKNSVMKIEDDIGSIIMLRKPQETRPHQILRISYPPRAERIVGLTNLRKKPWWDETPAQKEIITLEAQRRIVRDSRSLRKLRNKHPEHWIPCCVFGGGKETVFLQMNTNEIWNQVRKGQGFLSNAYRLVYEQDSDLVFPVNVQHFPPYKFYAIKFLRVTEQEALERMRKKAESDTMAIIRKKEKWTTQVQRKVVPQIEISPEIKAKSDAEAASGAVSTPTSTSASASASAKTSQKSTKKTKGTSR